MTTELVSADPARPGVAADFRIVPVHRVASPPCEELGNHLQSFRRQFQIVVPGLQGFLLGRIGVSAILSTKSGSVNLREVGADDAAVPRLGGGSSVERGSWADWHAQRLGPVSPVANRPPTIPRGEQR